MGACADVGSRRRGLLDAKARCLPSMPATGPAPRLGRSRRAERGRAGRVSRAGRLYPVEPRPRVKPSHTRPTDALQDPFFDSTLDSTCQNGAAALERGRTGPDRQLRLGNASTNIPTPGAASGRVGLWPTFPSATSSSWRRRQRSVRQRFDPPRLSSTRRAIDSPSRGAGPARPGARQPRTTVEPPVSRAGPPSDVLRSSPGTPHADDPRRRPPRTTTSRGSGVAARLGASSHVRS